MILSFPILNTQGLDTINKWHFICQYRLTAIFQHIYHCISVYLFMTSFFALQQGWPPCNSAPVTHSRFDKRLDGYHFGILTFYLFNLPWLRFPKMLKSLGKLKNKINQQSVDKQVCLYSQSRWLMLCLWWPHWLCWAPTVTCRCLRVVED